MALGAFIPQIWDAKILRTLEANLVARQICGIQPKGEIKKHGDTVHFAGLLDPAVNPYAGSITYETPLDSDIPLLIDQQNYFAFKVSDIDAAQANVDVKGSQAERAAYQLRNTCDKYILGLYTQAGLTTVVDANVDTASALSSVGLLSQALEEVNVEDDNKVIVIPPWLKLKLQLAGIKFSINEGIKGGAKGGMAWTNELGFDVYVSNNLTSGGTGNHKVIACSKNSIAFAEQIVSTRAMELENSFDVGISGLHVFGAKVIKPNEVVVGDFTYYADAAI